MLCMRLNFTLADVRDLQIAELLAWCDELANIVEEENREYERLNRGR